MCISEFALGTSEPTSDVGYGAGSYIAGLCIV